MGTLYRACQLCPDVAPPPASKAEALAEEEAVASLVEAAADVRMAEMQILRYSVRVRFAHLEHARDQWRTGSR